jgi:hypothetical protein
MQGELQMKKTMSLICLTILLLGVLIFTLPVNTIGGVDTSTSDPNEANGSGGSIWDRYDLMCDQKNLEKYKTVCFSDGSEQCTAKDCSL